MAVIPDNLEMLDLKHQSKAMGQDCKERTARGCGRQGHRCMSRLGYKFQLGLVRLHADSCASTILAGGSS